MNKFYIVNDKFKYLSHHGIEGQKHGVRNGPPYPLSAKAFSKAEKRAGAIVSRWASKSKKEKEEADNMIKNAKNAKNDKQLHKGMYKKLVANSWEAAANKLNDMENPYIRKANETKEEQKRRIQNGVDIFDEINTHYASTLYLNFARQGANYMVNSRLFKDYANVYMKQPADAFIEETKKR